MKRYLVAAAVAVTFGLGTANRAQAQISYTVPAFGGVIQGGNDFTRNGTSTFTNFFSPLLGTFSTSSSNLNTLFGRENFSTLNTPFTGFVSQTRGTAPTPFGPVSFTSLFTPRTGLLTEARFTNSKTNSTNTGTSTFFLNGFPITTGTGMMNGMNNNMNNNWSNNGWHHR